MLFDTRISEMVDYTNATLLPTWDCKLPLNVNDSDLRPEMKEMPLSQPNATEAVFAVIRSELGDFLRHCSFHLEFSNPVLKALANTQHEEGNDLLGLEKRLENDYLRFCNPENPLHFMTIWMTRAQLAKYHLVQHYSEWATAEQSETQRDSVMAYAIRMLECDTKITSSPPTKGYTWFANLYFPFPAYIQILQDLRRRPLSKHASYAWEVMNDNYNARFISPPGDDSPIFKLFSRIMVQAWEAREAASMQLNQPLAAPDVVVYFRERSAKPDQGAQSAVLAGAGDFMGQGVEDFAMQPPMGFGGPILPFDMGGQGGFGGMRPGASLNTGAMGEMAWAAMDWGFMNARGGGSATSAGLVPPPVSGPVTTPSPWGFS